MDKIFCSRKLGYVRPSRDEAVLWVNEYSSLISRDKLIQIVAEHTPNGLRMSGDQADFIIKEALRDLDIDEKFNSFDADVSAETILERLACENKTLHARLANMERRLLDAKLGPGASLGGGYSPTKS